MADGSPVTPELDARMLADLREWRRRIEPSPGRWSMRLTIDELDMLLRRCAEVDELKRQACEMSDERPSTAVEIPAGHALVDGEIVALASAGYRCIDEGRFLDERPRCGGIANYHAPECRDANA